MQWSIISPAFLQYGTPEWEKTERLNKKLNAYKEEQAGAYEKNRRNGLQEYVQKNKQTKTIQKPEKGPADIPGWYYSFMHIA